jgi:hypothetical protein
VPVGYFAKKAKYLHISAALKMSALRKKCEFCSHDFNGIYISDAYVENSFYLSLSHA